MYTKVNDSGTLWFLRQIAVTSSIRCHYYLPGRRLLSQLKSVTFVSWYRLYCWWTEVCMRMICMWAA